MNKFNYLVLLCLALGALTSWACEDEMLLELDDAQARGLKSTEMASPDLEDVPLSPVVVSFSEMLGKKSQKMNTINVTVENKASFETHVVLRLQCIGLLKFEEYLDLEETTLAAGEKKTLRIPIEALPIQSNSNVGQIRAEVQFKSTALEGDEFSKILTPSHYYIFEDNYKTLRLFKSVILTDEFGGVLVKPLKKDKFTKKPQKVKRGRVKTKAGIFVDVYSDDDHFKLKDGEIDQGYERGLDIEFGYDEAVDVPEEVQQ